MGTLTWLLIVAVGIVAGVAIGRFWPLDSLRMRTIEGERDSARAELERYRQEVSTHFQRTGQLFDRITSDYRSLYEHLASGADQLCAPSQADVLQAEPEQRKLALAHAEAAAQAEAAAPPEGASQSGAGATVGAAGTAAAAAVATDSDAGADAGSPEQSAQTDPEVATVADALTPGERRDTSPEAEMSPAEVEARAEAAAVQQQPVATRPAASDIPGSEAGNGLDDTAELATLKLSAADAANDEGESDSEAVAADAQGDDDEPQRDAQNGAGRRASA